VVSARRSTYSSLPSIQLEEDTSATSSPISPDKGKLVLFDLRVMQKSASERGLGCVEEQAGNSSNPVVSDSRSIYSSLPSIQLTEDTTATTSTTISPYKRKSLVRTRFDRNSLCDLSAMQKSASERGLGCVEEKTGNSSNPVFSDRRKGLQRSKVGEASLKDLFAMQKSARHLMK
jgi:hypothetical protein